MTTARLRQFAPKDPRTERIFGQREPTLVKARPNLAGASRDLVDLTPQSRRNAVESA